MQFGNFTIELLDTGNFALDGGAMFGVVPKNLWSKAYHAPDEENRIPMKASSLLIRTGERTILVDTGNGEKFPDKLATMYKIDNSAHNLENSLARFGLAPADVTDVILTHLHFDHAGGATKREGNTIVPTFPNARYHVQKEHLAWAEHPTEKDRASFVKENFEPLLANGMLHTTDGNGELFPGITLHTVFGHTKALQTVMIENAGNKAFFAADLMPTAAHIPVPYVMAYDNFPLTTIEEKKTLLPRLYEERTIVIFGHDGFVQASTIAATEKGFTRGDVIEITKY